MEEHLKNVYGYNGFREYQKDIITDILDGENVFAILPTGGGKSLLYQFPATYSNRITVIVSPLISLMNDQCEHMTSKNIATICLNSETDVKLDKLNTFTLIYTTPEFLTNRINVFKKLESSICLFAIDEAHCVSQWSHDFRESYQQLNIIKDMFPSIPLLAVTATATPRVLDDMYGLLNIEEATQYSLGTRRTNLAIRVLPKSDYENHVFDKPTIVYVQTRKLCESLCDDISNKGIKCACYHGGMPIQQKNTSHERFLKGDVLVIVATISFGMGIDKSDIREVINYGVPNDIESYYQEIGRAGRDGLMSETTIYYQSSDFATANYLINTSKDPEQRAIKGNALNTFRRYLSENHLCRQQMIEYYFENGTIPNEDEAKHIPKCGICDNCLCTKTLNMVDIKLEATFIVNYIKDFYTRNNYTLGLDKLSSAIRKDCGIINIKSKKKCIEIIEFLITKDILKRTSIGTGKYVINIGNNKIKSDQPLMAHMTPEIKTISVNTDKLSKFKEVRDILASKYNITPVVLINDRVLFNIQYKNPKNMSDLWKVDGISNDFIMRYGSEFLELLNKTASIKTNSKTNSKNVISDTVKETYKYYKQGKTTDEISKIRSIKSQTIESHILCVWENDEDSEIDMEYANLTDDLREKIMKVVEKVGEDRLRPIKDGLDSKVTYFQIRLSLLLKKLDL